MKNLYYDEQNLLRIEKEWTSSHRRNIEDYIENIPLGIVLPLIDVINYLGMPDLECGVLNAQGEYVKESGMRNYSLGEYILPGEIKYMDCSVIYCGWLINHYGHFLLQSTTRLYAALDEKYKDMKIVFVSKEKNIADFIWQFLELLSINKDRVIIIDECTRFRNVICPSISSRYYLDFTDNFLLPFKQASSGISPAKYKKVYLTRKYWHNSIGKCFGESEIEKLFENNGFKIIAPEKLSIKEQVAVFKGAEQIAGINGTSFHNAVFSNRNTTLIILNRNEEFDSQYIVNEAVGCKWVVIKVHENPLPVTHPHGPFIVGVTRYLEEFCHDNHFKMPNVKFFAFAYLKDFLMTYTEVYSNDNYYKELVARNKNVIDVKNLVYIFYFILNFEFRYRVYRILYIFSFGKLRKVFKRKYLQLTKPKEQSQVRLERF